MLPFLLACGPDPVLTLTDADNHTVTVTADIPTLPFDANAEDLAIDWEQVSTDLRCRDASLSEPTLTLLTLDMTEEELAVAIETDDFRSRHLTGFMEQHPRAGEPTWITGMSISGTYMEMDFNDNFLYLLVLSEGNLGPGSIATIALITPDEASTETTLTLPEGCGMFETEVSFAPAVSLKGVEQIRWSEATETAAGGVFIDSDISHLQLAFFSGRTPDDLAADYLSLEEKTTQLWRQDITGLRSFEMADLVGFDSADGDGTWVMALTCEYCTSPVPPFMAVVTE